MKDILKGFGASTFGEIYAEDYDLEHDPGTTAEAVQLLAEIAGAGKILELAIGTGRVALPLAQRGLTVLGIDGSPAMVAKLREKSGGARARRFRCFPALMRARDGTSPGYRGRISPA